MCISSTPKKKRLADVELQYFLEIDHYHLEQYIPQLSPNKVHINYTEKTHAELRNTRYIYIYLDLKVCQRSSVNETLK